MVTLDPIFLKTIKCLILIFFMYNLLKFTFSTRYYSTLFRSVKKWGQSLWALVITLCKWKGWERGRKLANILKRSKHNINIKNKKIKLFNSKIFVDFTLFKNANTETVKNQKTSEKTHLLFKFKKFLPIVCNCLFIVSPYNCFPFLFAVIISKLPFWLY